MICLAILFCLSTITTMMQKVKELENEISILTSSLRRLARGGQWDTFQLLKVLQQAWYWVQPKKNMPKLLARRNSIKGASSRRLELIVVIARMLDITLGSSLFLRAFHLLCSLTLHLALRELTIILWRQRVKGKFIGIQAKGKLPNKTWVPKSLADHYWRPLLGSPRSEGFMRKGR